MSRPASSWCHLGLSERTIDYLQWSFRWCGPEFRTFRRRNNFDARPKLSLRPGRPFLPLSSCRGFPFATCTLRPTLARQGTVLNSPGNHLGESDEERCWVCLPCLYVRACKAGTWRLGHALRPACLCAGPCWTRAGRHGQKIDPGRDLGEGTADCHFLGEESPAEHRTCHCFSTRRGATDIREQLASNQQTSLPLYSAPAVASSIFPVTLYSPPHLVSFTLANSIVSLPLASSDSHTLVVRDTTEPWLRDW